MKKCSKANRAKIIQRFIFNAKFTGVWWFRVNPTPPQSVLLISSDILTEELSHQHLPEPHPMHRHLWVMDNPVHPWSATCPPVPVPLLSLTALTALPIPFQCPWAKMWHKYLCRHDRWKHWLNRVHQSCSAVKVFWLCPSLEERTSPQIFGSNFYFLLNHFRYHHWSKSGADRAESRQLYKRGVLKDLQQRKEKKRVRLTQ